MGRGGGLEQRRRRRRQRRLLQRRRRRQLLRRAAGTRGPQGRALEPQRGREPRSLSRGEARNCWKGGRDRAVTFPLLCRGLGVEPGTPVVYMKTGESVLGIYTDNFVLVTWGLAVRPLLLAKKLFSAGG